MATANVITTYEGVGGALEGFFKKRFGKLETLIPQQTQLQEAIPFSSENKLGDEYVQVVELQSEHGFTYIAPTEDYADLAGAVRGATKKATIRGSQQVLQTLVGYKGAFAGEGGEQSFANLYKNRIKNMWLSSHRRLEFNMIHGQNGLGTIESYDASGGVYKLKITPATWAPGIWTGMVGAEFQIWQTGFTNQRHVAGETYTITKVKTQRGTDTDYTHRSIYFTPVPSTAPQATDIIVMKGEKTGSTWNTMQGIYQLGTSTSAVHGIDPTVYDQWDGIQIPCSSGDLSFPLLLDGLSEAYGKGGDGDYDLYVNPKAWTNMSTDEGALRRYDWSYSKEKATKGVKALEYQGLGGMVFLKPHAMIPEGWSLGLQTDEFMRIGATDITFKKPAYMPGSGDFFIALENKTAWEMRNYSDQAVFCECPGHMIVWTGQVLTT